MKAHDRSILFLYWKPWDLDMVAFARDQVPSHRLASYNELVDHGLALAYVRCPMRLFKFMREHTHIWMFVSNMKAFIAQASGTTDVMATGDMTVTLLLILKRLGLVKARIFFTNIGLLKSENLTGFRRSFWSYLLKGADRVISHASGQLELMQEYFQVPLEKQRFVPFGVDLAFFKSSRLRRQLEQIPGALDDTETGYVIAAGNPGRDYITAIKAAQILKDVKFRIYTGSRKKIDKEFPTLPENVALMPGKLPFAQLTDVYKRAAVGLVPLIKTEYSCGQTVLLELMAAQLPVVVTSSTCTKDYVIDGETALMVPPLDAEMMAEKIRFLIDNPDQAKAMGERAAKSVAERFNSDTAAEGFAKAICETSDK